VSGLTDFFMENSEKVGIVKYAPSSRFRGEDGNPIEWELRALSNKEVKELRKLSGKKVLDKKGREVQDVDTETYISKMVVECIVYPNLNDVELQNSYGVMEAEKLLDVMLICGEYNRLMNKIQEINQYHSTIEDEEREAKNS